ncbi:hypothetical protein DYP60_12530 [Sphaerochaeta halotolerans]|uniref:Uncharacterized protein n=1 Tax=Sphaerochaeta halotolerans TaxID=2293840 RepID=A0A372MDP6_9SPIR|nr:hypothetical protein DYP60_12530 [Sphaerochaeta halotolerans]
MKSGKCPHSQVCVLDGSPIPKDEGETTKSVPVSQIRYKDPVFQNHSQTNTWKEEASQRKRSIRSMVCCFD